MVHIFMVHATTNWLFLSSSSSYKRGEEMNGRGRKRESTCMQYRYEQCVAGLKVESETHKLC